MIEKYIQIANLLDQAGPMGSRLDSIKEIIQRPDFKYEKKSFPEIFTDTLALSSYWLHMELFDERCLYKIDLKNLTGEQEDHLKMLDIGCLLIDKGFPLKFQPRAGAEMNAGIADYARTFMEQCHKRHAFLKKQKKLPHIIPSQKIKE